MGNCLVTKLKGSVDNNNLEYLGYVSIKLSVEETPSAANRHMYLAFSENTTIKVLNGTFVQSDLVTPIGTEINCQAGGGYEVWISNTEATVLIPKYSIIYLTFASSKYCSDGPVFNGDTSFLKYSPIANMQLRSEKDINISDIISTALVDFNCRMVSSSKVSGDIAAFANKENLTRIYLLGSTPITGNISSLAQDKKLVDIFIDSCSNDLGDVESLAQGQVSAGRTSGTLSIVTNSDCIKYQNAFVRNISITFDSSLPDGYSIQAS